MAVWLGVVALLAVVHFDLPPIITWDSAHYHTYLAVLEGRASWEQWDVVRGAVFPLHLLVMRSVFGRGPGGALVFTFLHVAATCALIFLLVRRAWQAPRARWLAATACLLVFLNPVVMGYYHTLLTEFVAATWMMLGVVIACRVLGDGATPAPPARARAGLAALLVLSILAWHLKQPYASAGLGPLVAIPLVELVRGSGWKRVAARFGVLVAAGLLVIGSARAWSAFLPGVGPAADKGNESAALFQGRLLRTLEPSAEFCAPVGRGSTPGHCGRCDLTPHGKGTHLPDCDGWVRIVTSSGSGIERMYLMDGQGTPTLRQAVTFVFRFTLRHPFLAMRRFAQGFAEVAGLTPGPLPPENDTIAMRPYRMEGVGQNIFYLSDRLLQLVASYRSSHLPRTWGLLPATLLAGIQPFLFTGTFLVFGWLWLPLALWRRWRLHRNGAREADPVVDPVLMVGSITVWVHLTVHVLLAASIDRYAVPAFPLGLVLAVFAAARAFTWLRGRASV